MDVEALLEDAQREQEDKEAREAKEQRRTSAKNDRRRSRSPAPRKASPAPRVKPESPDRKPRVKDEDGDEEMHILGCAKPEKAYRSSRGSSPPERRDERDRRGNGGRRSSGDYYRGGGRPRSRSRSPDPSRYRPSPRTDRYDRASDRPRDPRSHGYRERDDDRGNGRYNDRGRGGPPRNRSPNPQKDKPSDPPLTEDERDARTIFVQQLAARLRTRDLTEFFSKVGPVKEAQIVKDRVSGRSKGVGYVEFKEEESVKKAIELTGQKLLGIPIIAQLTEAEKNRQARNTDSGDGNKSSVPFHRLYVGNIHFSITEADLQNVFEPFGELEFVQLQKEETGRSKGYGFVQFNEAAHAKEALDRMNNFELAGRQIRVGLGNDKFTPESTANLLQRFNSREQSFQGSAFSGQGGRGAQAGGGGGNFDRAGGRDNEKGAGGASALDDTDVAGVNFSNYSRDSLMRKLARTDGDGTGETQAAPKPKKQLPIEVHTASRCVVMRNAFDPVKELEATGPEWVKDLEQDIKTECEEKHGKIVHIAVDPNSQGDCYMKFEKIAGGESAIKGLNGRYFNGNMVTAEYMVGAVYDAHFPRSKLL